MARRMIDGERWIAERLAFLNQLLDGEVSDEQREAIQAEIQTLEGERGIRQGGPRLLHWHPRRWLAHRRSRRRRSTG